jgi:hypothetical protein
LSSIADAEIKFGRMSLSKDTLTITERLAGLIKVYVILKYFYPYWSNNSFDFTTHFLNFIRPCVDADSLEEYYRLLCQFTKPLKDSHLKVYYNMRSVQKAYIVPYRFENIENQTVVSEGPFDSLTPKIPIGSQILAFNDVPIASFESYWVDRISASIPSTAIRDIYWDVAPMPLAGSKGSSLKVLYRYEKKVDSVSLIRSIPLTHWSGARINAGALMINDTVGYIQPAGIRNLQEYRDVISKFLQMKVVVLDLRSRWKWGSVNDIVDPFIHDSMTFGFEEIPVVSLGKTEWKRRSLRFIAKAKQEGVYCGKLIVLINNYTQSGSEGPAYILKAARRACFIGSQTASTPGAISWIFLPGGGYTQFTGCRIVTPEGKLFWGQGVMPDIEVYPTVEGIRTGKDEILTAAINSIH